MTRKPERRFVILSDGSFRVTRDDEEEKRPTKRKRVDSDDEDEGRRAGPGVSSTSPTRPSTGDADPKPTSSNGQEEGSSKKRLYYARDADFFYGDIPDANIYIGVEKTVFKIHQHVLECCPRMVQDYKYQDSTTSEESPLVINRSTVEEYKAFLWVNYATVEELNAPPHENKFIERLHLIVSLTQKYRIPKLESWTSSAVSGLTDDTVYLSSCSSSTLTHIAAACVAYQLKEPLAKLTKMWIARLERSDTPSVPAIIASDDLDLPARLRGLAYYLHLQDMVDRRGMSSTGAMQLRTDDKLNNGQILRLYAGNMSLNGYWEHLRIKPIALPVPPSGGSDTPSSGTAGNPGTPNRFNASTSTAPGTPTASGTPTPGTSTPNNTNIPTCPGGETHQKRCVATWERRWISAAGWKRILGISNSDALALLACLRDQLANDEETKNGMEPGCRAAGLEALRALRAKVREDLNDHFLGVA